MDQTNPINKSNHPKRSTGKIIGITAIIILALLIIFGITFPIISGMPVYSPSHSVKIDQVTSSTDLFKFDPKRIQIGTVYHYIKSNIDGTKAAKVALYVASDTHIEVFKIYPGSTATALVTADMDWTKYSPRLMESYDVHADGSRTPVINGELMPGDRYQFFAANLLWVRNRTSFAPIGHYPVHNYNFDLASLNYSFRHLIDPTKDFEIGIQMPWFDFIHLGEMEYLGKATIHYLGEEACHNTLCRKYQIGGIPFGNQQGTLWVNKEGGYFEKVEIPVRDNPSWKDFKLELSSIDEKSPDEWQQYIKTETENYLKNN